MEGGPCVPSDTHTLGGAGYCGEVAGRAVFLGLTAQHSDPGSWEAQPGLALLVLVPTQQAYILVALCQLAQLVDADPGWFSARHSLC